MILAFFMKTRDESIIFRGNQHYFYFALHFLSGACLCKVTSTGHMTTSCKQVIFLLDEVQINMTAVDTPWKLEQDLCLTLPENWDTTAVRQLLHGPGEQSLVHASWMQSRFISGQCWVVITSADLLSFRWVASSLGGQWSYAVGEEAWQIWLGCSGIFFQIAEGKGRVLLFSVAGC